MKKHFLWGVEQIILTKLIFQKLPKIVEKHFLKWVEQIVLTKNTFLAHFEIIQNYHHFARVDIPSKFNLPKIA